MSIKVTRIDLSELDETNPAQDIEQRIEHQIAQGYRLISTFSYEHYAVFVFESVGEE